MTKVTWRGGDQRCALGSTLSLCSDVEATDLARQSSEYTLADLRLERAYRELIASALAAWQRCEAAEAWPKEIDTLLFATYENRLIVRPMRHGKFFSIFRVADSSVVSADDLVSADYMVDTEDILAWEVLELTSVFAW